MPATPEIGVQSPATPGCVVVTTPYVPGFRIRQVLGLTFGLIVQSRGLGGNLAAGLRTIPGGEITEFTQLLDWTRTEAVNRLVQRAIGLGANAVISFGFDTSDLGQVMSEVVAYGTAVVIEPDSNPVQAVALR